MSFAETNSRARVDFVLVSNIPQQESETVDDHRKCIQLSQKLKV